MASSHTLFAGRTSQGALHLPKQTALPAQHMASPRDCFVTDG